MKKIIILFLACILLLGAANQTFASYDAGYSKNWPETVDGAKGKVTSSQNKLAPFAYTTGDTISLQFTIENPENNQTISPELFLHIWKVENVDANKQTLTEDKLAQNHEQKKDSQSLYHTQTLGPVVLTPGDSSQFETSFTILDPGYYQFDLTDQDGSSFTPGHIYAAGFLRVKGAGDEAILGTKTTSTNSIWKKVLFISGLALALLTLLFLLWKRQRKPQPAPQTQTHGYLYR